MKISRPPSPITRAAARAPRNAPVRFTSRTWRQTEASISRGPATIGEIPALQIHTSTPPHSATVASATASLKSSSVTSPLSTRRRPGQRLGDRLEVLLGAGHQRHRRAGVARRRGRAAPEAAAGAGDHDPLARRPRRAGEGLGDLDLIGHRPVPVCTDQYNTSFVTLGRPSPPAVLEPRPGRDAPPHAADPRVRGAGGRPLPRRRDPRLRAPLDRAGGDGGRRVLAAAARPTSSPPPTAATATAWPRASTRSGCSPS